MERGSCSGRAGLTEETAHSRGAWGRPQEGAADAPHAGSEGRGLGGRWSGETASEGACGLRGLRTEPAEGRQGQVAAAERQEVGPSGSGAHGGQWPRLCPRILAATLSAGGRVSVHSAPSAWPSCRGPRAGRGWPALPEGSVVPPRGLRRRHPGAAVLEFHMSREHRRPLPLLGNAPRSPGPTGGGEPVTPTRLSSACPPPALLKEGCRQPA